MKIQRAKNIQDMLRKQKVRRMTLLVIQSYDKATTIKTVFLVQGWANRPVGQERGQHVWTFDPGLQNGNRVLSKKRHWVFWVASWRKK